MLSRWLGVEFSLVSVFLIAFSIVSCRSAEETILFPVNSVVTGTILMVGNEPFVCPALELTDGRIVRVAPTKDLKSLVYGNQGKVVRATLGTATQVPDGPVYELTHLEFVKR